MPTGNKVDDFVRALEDGAWGTFPFGQPNVRRPPTLPSDSSGPVLAVLGVYPSALHLSWHAPEGDAAIGALAVDVEPRVFWSGDNGAERAQRIAAWKRATHDDGSHGSFGWAPYNGSSGVGIARNYLEPLGVSYEQCFLTDCVPFFFVKSGKGEQGTAIDNTWKNCAVENGWEGGDLPSRPSATTIVQMATHAARALADELASAQTTAILTLGQEAADTLEKVVEVITPPPGLPLRAYDDAYGNPGRIRLGGREVTWIPLAHPGATGRNNTAWHTCHDDWKKTAQHLVAE
jgi:uracil-DNA glycosylase